MAEAFAAAALDEAIAVEAASGRLRAAGSICMVRAREAGTARGREDYGFMRMLDRGLEGD